MDGFPQIAAKAKTFLKPKNGAIYENSQPCVLASEHVGLSGPSDSAVEATGYDSYLPLDRY